MKIKPSCISYIQLSSFIINVQRYCFQVISLSPHANNSGCTRNVTEDGRRVIDCKSRHDPTSDEESLWNVAVSSCGSPTGLDFHYFLVIYGHTGDCYTGEIDQASLNSSCFAVLLLSLFISLTSITR